MIRAHVADLIGMLRTSELVRRSSVMLSGVIGAKVVALLALLLLARLYSTEAFGLLGLLQAIVVIVSVVASLGYHAAIALPRQNDEAASVFWLALGLVVTATFLVTGVAATCGDGIARILDAPALAGLIWWAPGLLLGLASYEVFSCWSTRRRAFRRLATSRVAMTLAVAMLQVAAWLAGGTHGGLIAGLVLGTLVAALILAAQSWRDDEATLRGGLSWSGVRTVAGEYRQFPAFQAPAAVLNAASISLIPLGLGFFFGPAVVGIYWLADRACGYLTNLVRQSIQQVFLNRAAEVVRERADVRALFRRTTIALASLGLPLTVALLVAGPFLFQLAFGAEWIEAGTFARWLGVSWFFSLVNIPAVQLIAVFHLQRWVLVYSIGLAAIRVGALAAGAVTGDPVLLIVIFSTGSALASLVLILAVSLYLGRGARATALATN